LERLRSPAGRVFAEDENEAPKEVNLKKYYLERSSFWPASTPTTAFPRKILIYISDSFKKYNSRFDKKSWVLSPKTPFNQDLNLIDYEQDSEEEL